jgi:pimeloyl-ACP methyl ester carboxylesterase
MRTLLGLAVTLLVTSGAAALGSTTAQTSTSSCTGRGDVHFTASDKTRLVGHTFGKGKTAVVLAHQARSSMCQWLRYAKRLVAKGYRAFVFDFRNHGLSQQVGYPRSGRLAGDVAAAVRYVRAHGASKVFLVGASMGGTAAIVGGANIRPLVAGVVSLSGPASFGGADAAPAAPRLRVPVLYIAATDDAGGAFAQDARALYEATSSPDKELELLPGSAHGVSLVSSAGTARDLVEQFLASY